MDAVNRALLYGAWQVWVLDASRRRRGAARWDMFLFRLGSMPRIGDEED